ncbi:MAG: DUF4190 domain-containing protein [Christensenellaceae bacterium]|jgi:hypothetical protein|nr:DUF4190 domain-containing protein [Christensenellaceae bacterium]
MFNCPKCSAEVRYGAKYCKHCGCEMNWDRVNQQAVGGSQAMSGTNAKWSVLSIVGFVLSLTMCGIISLILSILGKKECKEKGYQGGGLALAGIIISVVGMVFAVIAIIGMFILMNVYGITLAEFFERFYYA